MSMGTDGRIRRLALTLAVVAGGVLGCGGEASPEAEDAAPGSELGASDAASEAAPDATLTDGEIAAIVVTANGIDVRNGELALERAEDERVKQFAQTMITDHTAVNESAAALVDRLGVTPQENEMSRSLESSSAQTHEQLSTQTGAEFDRAYIANEVKYHRAVLDALDNQLIPNASNEELRETLVNVRPAFEAHLQHAESLQEALGGS